MAPVLLFAALSTDLIVGDPRWLLHPTQMMGFFITWLEGFLRRITRTPLQECLAGGFLVVVIVAGSFMVTYALLLFADRLFSWLGLFLAVWLLSTTIAARGLAIAGEEVYRHLTGGDLVKAQKTLSWIVGRDTESLPAEEVARGAVETIAENTVDGVIAPLFYVLIGGVPLAMAYRAVNTLDSMLGYKNQRYRYFGLVAARLDDVANFLPARLTGLIMLIVVKMLGLPSRNAWKIWHRDASKHPSLNSGIPEAVVAGALQVRLGGTNYYQGEPSVRAYLGDMRQQIEGKHIKDAIRIMYGTAGSFCLLATVWLLLR